MNKRMIDVIKNGKKFETEYFTLYLKNSCNFLKMGFKINFHFSTSVTRNRIKRIFRSLIRETFENGDIIVRIKSGCKGLTGEEIRKEWTAIKKKVF
ncbi:MAG: ribonuclease P protein component [Candidatus Omnitrophica bacterium]|nr:ribonuclease P protein component [Candidatus Omnitrophota bacterium]